MRGSAAGRKFLAPPTTTSEQCLRLSERFFVNFLLSLFYAHADKPDSGVYYCRRQGDYVFAFVCLSVDRITQNVEDVEKREKFHNLL